MTVQADTGYVVPDWSFGDRVRKARDISRLNQKDFAVAIGVSEGSIATWETDRAKPRDIVSIAKRIEMLTRIPAAWILDIGDGVGRGPEGPNGGEIPVSDETTHLPVWRQGGTVADIDARRRRVSRTDRVA